MKCEILRYCPDTDMLNVVVKHEPMGIWYTHDELLALVGEQSTKQALKQFFEEN